MVIQLLHIGEETESGVILSGKRISGRLHRDHADKHDVRIYDYVDYDNPQLARMWDKRLRGYRNMGYIVCSA